MSSAANRPSSQTSFFVPLLRVLRGHRLAMAASIAFGVLFAGTTLVPPLLIRTVIQQITERREWLGAMPIVLGLLGVYVLRGVCRYLYGRYSHVVAYETLDELMVKVYRQVQRLSHRFFSERHTGELISRSINDIEVLEDFIAHGIPQTCLAVIIPAAMLCVLVLLNAELTLIVIAPLPFVALSVFLISRRIKKRWDNVRGGLAALVAEVGDSFAGISEIQSFARERHQEARIVSHSARHRDALIHANQTSLIPLAVVEVAAGVGLVLAVWMGGNFALNGTMTVADLFVFILYLGQIYQPFLQIAGIADSLHRAASSGRRVFELLAIEPEIVTAPNAISPRNMDWGIEFRNVSFAYTNTKPALQQINFSVESGEVVALFGHSGAGKTTITRLLHRFYDPTEGAVLVGGYDLRGLDLNFLRQNVGAVTQEVFLFRGTVRQNILFGRPDASEDELREAARAANADEFISQLPDGYDTMVGERGVKLSGGERQRIAIARTLLKNAPILILDEATSAVDHQTEVLIQQALARLMEGRTTLIIAHRLSTIRQCNRILLLKEGRVSAILTNQEFFANDGHHLAGSDLQGWETHQGFPELRSAPSN